MACPLYVIQVYEDYTHYYAVLCDPGPVQYVGLDSYHNSALGTCGMNPDCVPYGTFARTTRLTDSRLASAGLPRLGDPTAKTRLGEGTELLDEQLVDIVPESATPAAPVRVRLFLLKHTPAGSGSSAKLIASGHEVRREGEKNVPLVLASQAVTVNGRHTCSVRLGDVEYHVVLHQAAEALLAKKDPERQ